MEKKIQLYLTTIIEVLTMAKEKGVFSGGMTIVTPTKSDSHILVTVTRENKTEKILDMEFGQLVAHIKFILNTHKLTFEQLLLLFEYNRERIKDNDNIDFDSGYDINEVLDVKGSILKAAESILKETEEEGDKDDSK